MPYRAIAIRCIATQFRENGGLSRPSCTAVLLRHRLRAVLSTLAQYQPERIKQFDVRFSKPVFPGETLVVEMWQDGGGSPSRLGQGTPGTVVLNNGLCLLADA